MNGKIKGVQGELISRGKLSWQLHPYQKDVYDFLVEKQQARTKRVVILCRRRRGKTHTVLLFACEYAMQNPGKIIRIAAVTQKQTETIIHPIMRIIFENAKPEDRPKWKQSHYVFPNGSEMWVAGTDDVDAREKLRGASSDLNIVDEAGSQKELDYTVRSILAPQTLTTGGMTILISTPSITPEHDFKAFCDESELKRNLITRSILDDKYLMPLKQYNQLLEDAIEESGGEETSHFKREYLISWVTDEDRALVPEWDDKYCYAYINPDVYHLYHKYIAMDIGTVDFTALLFGFYNFREAKIYIEDEITLKGPEVTTEAIAFETNQLQNDLWGQQKTHRNIADSNNKILLSDLANQHEIYFSPTGKDTLIAMVNKVREWVNAGRIIIHPRCKMLHMSIKAGIWDVKRKEFARNRNLGHFDHFAALVYLVRNIDEYSNPIPANHMVSESDHFIPPPSPTETTKSQQTVKDLFGSTQNNKRINKYRR